MSYSRIVRLLIILGLISIYLMIASCKENSGAQISRIKFSTPSEAVFSFIESSERGDVAAVTQLISDVPESYNDYCREGTPDSKPIQQTIRIEEGEGKSAVEKPKTTENQGGPFLRVRAKSQEQRHLYEIAEHIQINTYFDTVSKTVSTRVMNDEALVLIKRGKADDSITLLLAFHLIKENENWKIFLISPLYGLDDLKKVTYGAERPKCKELS